MGLFDFLKKKPKPIQVNMVEKELTPFKAKKRTVDEVYRGYPEKPYISPERNMHSWLEQVSLFGKVVPKENMIRRNGLLPGHIMILWRISLENFSTASTLPQYLEYEYGIHGYEAIDFLLMEQMIEFDTNENNLSLLTIPELKEILKTKALKVGGNKGELISRLKENFNAAEIDGFSMKKKFILTDKGRKELESQYNVIEQYNYKNTPAPYTEEDKIDHSKRKIEQSIKSGFFDYEIISSDNCKRHNHFTNKIYDARKAVIGVNCPPFDSDCTCSIITVIDGVLIADRDTD